MLLFGCLWSQNRLPPLQAICSLGKSLILRASWLKPIGPCRADSKLSSGLRTTQRNPTYVSQRPSDGWKQLSLLSSEAWSWRPCDCHHLQTLPGFDLLNLSLLKTSSGPASARSNRHDHAEQKRTTHFLVLNTPRWPWARCWVTGWFTEFTGCRLGLLFPTILALWAMTEAFVSFLCGCGGRLLAQVKSIVVIFLFQLCSASPAAQMSCVWFFFLLGALPTHPQPCH